MINLRAETVREKKGWKSTLARKRCIIPIDGFYEWQDQGKGQRKQPFYITSRDFSPLALAGLWATWRDPESGEELFTCTILTTSANDLMESVHHRMPVILSPEDWDTWLDPENTDTEELAKLLVPAPEELLTLWPVDKAVGNVRNNRPEPRSPWRATSRSLRRLGPCATARRSSSPTVRTAAAWPTRWWGRATSTWCSCSGGRPTWGSCGRTRRSPASCKLSSFSRLILFDRLGDGLSDRGPSGHTFDDEMDDVRRDGRAGWRAAFFGCHTGGRLALLLAATHPDEVSAVATFGSHPATLRDDDYPWGSTPTEREEVFAMIREFSPSDMAERLLSYVAPARWPIRRSAPGTGCSRARRPVRWSRSRDQVPRPGRHPRAALDDPGAGAGHAPDR